MESEIWTDFGLVMCVWVCVKCVMGFIWRVLTSKGPKKKKSGDIHIRCEKYFLCGYKVSTVPESI